MHISSNKLVVIDVLLKTDGMLSVAVRSTAASGVRSEVR